MLRDEKWIEYAIKILKAVDLGAKSIANVANDIGGSESYIAKVIAVLRRGGLITTTYTLSRSLDQITVAEVVALADPSPVDSLLVRRIVDRMLGSLNVPIRQVLENT